MPLGGVTSGVVGCERSSASICIECFGFDSGVFFVMTAITFVCFPDRIMVIFIFSAPTFHSFCLQYLVLIPLHDEKCELTPDYHQW